MQHPQVVRPTFHKGINYFDVNYHRGATWYGGHFPTRFAARVRSPKDCEPVAFEASGYYMFHPLALSRIAADLPHIKLVAMLRDPVERAYSAWKHESERGFEDQTFIRALEMEGDRLAGEAERMRVDATYQSYSHRHHAYRARGEYLSLLHPSTGSVPREQLHVLYSEDFFANPAEEFTRLSDFLGLRRHALTHFERYNARPSVSMPAEGRRILQDHFSGQRRELENFVGRPAPWPIEN